MPSVHANAFQNIFLELLPLLMRLILSSLVYLVLPNSFVSICLILCLLTRTVVGKVLLGRGRVVALFLFELPTEIRSIADFSGSAVRLCLFCSKSLVIIF